MTESHTLAGVSSNVLASINGPSNAVYVGSTIVYPYNDTTNMKPIELGASIFVRANKNLWRASDEFNLTRLDFEDEDSDMGIWDGQDFLLTVRPPLPLADSADLILFS